MFPPFNKPDSIAVSLFHNGRAGVKSPEGKSLDA
jgi:hypothetical protein